MKNSLRAMLIIQLINDSTLKLSLKVFLATEQRILDIGNGVVQDILFNAKMHPKRKLNTLSKEEIDFLYHSVVDTIGEMVNNGGSIYYCGNCQK